MQNHKCFLPNFNKLGLREDLLSWPITNKNCLWRPH